MEALTFRYSLQCLATSNTDFEIFQDQTHDADQPFGCPLIFDIIQSQWFRNASVSKPDYDAAVRMVKEKSVPVHLILTVTSAVSFYKCSIYV